MIGSSSQCDGRFSGLTQQIDTIGIRKVNQNPKNLAQAAPICHQPDRRIRRKAGRTGWAPCHRGRHMIPAWTIRVNDHANLQPGTRAQSEST